MYCLEKLNSRQLYNMQLILKVEKPSAQTYSEKIFNPNLGGLFRGSFWGGGGGKITPLPPPSKTR